MLAEWLIYLATSDCCSRWNLITRFKPAFVSVPMQTKLAFRTKPSTYLHLSETDLDTTRSEYDWNKDKPKTSPSNTPPVDQTGACEIPLAVIRLTIHDEMNLRQKDLARKIISRSRCLEDDSHGTTTRRRSLSKKRFVSEILHLLGQLLCPENPHGDLEQTMMVLPTVKASVHRVMPHIYHRCAITHTRVSLSLSLALPSEGQPSLSLQETTSIDQMGMSSEPMRDQCLACTHSHTDVPMPRRRKQSSARRRRKRERTITILPHENTYATFYHPEVSNQLPEGMIEKIIGGVQAMIAALSSRVKSSFTWIRQYWLQRDVEDVLNGIAMLDDQSTSPQINATNNRITDEVISTIHSKNIHLADRHKRSSFRTTLVTKIRSDDQQWMFTRSNGVGSNSRWSSAQRSADAVSIRVTGSLMHASKNASLHPRENPLLLRRCDQCSQSVEPGSDTPANVWTNVAVVGWIHRDPRWNLWSFVRHGGHHEILHRSERGHRYW